jgi:methyl-accepting chemotaxis protein
MNQTKQMKVATQLMIGFGVAGLLGIFIAAIGAYRLHDLAGDLEEISRDRMVKVEKFTQLKDNNNAISRWTRNVLLMKEPAEKTAERSRIADMRAQNNKLTQELEKLVTLPKGVALLKQIADSRAQYNQQLDAVLDLDAKGNTAEAAALLVGNARATQQAFFKAIDESVAMQRELATELASDANKAATKASVVMGALAVAMGFVGVIAAWLLIRNLTRSLGAEPGELGEAARRVAEGDLSTVEGASRAPAGSVMSSLGEMQGNLAKLVSQVRGASDSIATGSSQIAMGNADLSQRTEEQASNVQQTAASMEQMNSTVKNNADTARQAAQLATSASETAQKGGEVVGHVVATMDEITDSSKKISDIIGVIDGIAFQTNILALNAAVEAARAGEQGRGFAVVAGEVRSLAQRSAEAAKEIKSLIGSSVEKVETGSRLVGDAGATMQDIVSQVQRVADLISEISSATIEQTEGIGQVSGAVAQLDQVTQQNAALVEQSAAAADSLKQQAAQLTELVSVFKLDHDVRAVSTSRTVDLVPAKPKAVTTIVQKPKTSTTTAITKPITKTAPAKLLAAPKTTPAPAAAPVSSGGVNPGDDWETF